MRAVRVLHSAQMTYASVYGNGNFGTIGALGQAQLIDPALATGTKYGYVFSITLTPASGTTPADFVVNAVPHAYRKTGRISYVINVVGEIHGADHGGLPANMNDPYLDDCTTGTVIENERCTISSLRTLHGAEQTYAATAGNNNYGLLPALAATGLITPRLASGTFRGYLFTVFTTAGTPQTPALFHINAVPQVYGVTGIRSFYVDQTGVIRGADRQGQPADQNDPPV